MASLKFASLEENHIERVREIETLSNPSPWTYESFVHEVKNPNGLFLVANAGDTIVGYGAVWFVIDEAHITTLAVAESERKQGYGRQIVNALLEEAQERGMTCATLEVRASNSPAIHLYESLGFTVVGTRKKYYPNNKEDALVMWLYNLGSLDRGQS